MTTENTPKLKFRPCFILDRNVCTVKSTGSMFILLSEPNFWQINLSVVIDINLSSSRSFLMVEIQDDSYGTVNKNNLRYMLSNIVPNNMIIEWKTRTRSVRFGLRYLLSCTWLAAQVNLQGFEIDYIWKTGLKANLVIAFIHKDHWVASATIWLNKLYLDQCGVHVSQVEMPQ